MKKKLLLLLLALTLVLFCFTLASCGDDEDGESGKSEDCEHNWTVEFSRDATCYDYGEQQLRCSNCGDKDFKQIPPLGHDEVISQGTAATCTEGGLTDGKICNRCGEVLEEQSYIPPLGHTPVTDSGKTPTCTEGGITEGAHCSTCNTVLEAQNPIDPSGHYWEYSYGYEATCTSAGLTDGKFCSICNHVESTQTVIPATGHTPATNEGYDATCLEEGLSDGSYCSVCYETITEQETIPAKGHTIVSLNSIPPTCESDGVSGSKECSVCKVVFEAPATLPKVDHSFENGACIWCELTQSTGLEFAAVGSEAYELSGVGSFSGDVLVIPDKYEGKDVIGIAEGALQNQTAIREIIVTGRLEYIEANAFSGCSALVSISLPETVTDVKANAFSGCPALVTVKCVDFAQTEDWENGWKGDSSSASLLADEKDGLTPYELYFAAMAYINSNLDSYTAVDNTRLIMNRDGSYSSDILQFIAMLEMETYAYCEYAGLEFYLYQSSRDYEGTQSSAAWYYNGYLYQSVGSTAIKAQCGSEFIRDSMQTAYESRPQFSENFFNSVKFYKNGDGTYTLVVDVSGDAMTEFLASQEGGSFVGQTGFSYTTVVYEYNFDANGNLTYCGCVADFIFENITTDAQGNPLSLTGQVLLDQTYTDVGTLTSIKTAPSGSFADQTPPNSSQCTHPSYVQKTVKGKAATCTEAGISDGVYCGACLRNITVSEVISPLGHDMQDGKCTRCETEDAPEAVLSFEFNSDGKTATLVGILELNGDEIVIPADIHGVLITKIDKDAFKNVTYLYSISVPASVTEIEAGAFEGITGLKKISLPASLVSSLPKDIEEVEINSGKVISAGSFVDFKSLFKITLPYELEEIEDGAFVGCDKLLVIYNNSDYLYNIFAGNTDNGGIAANAEQVLRGDAETSVFVQGDFVFKRNGEIYTLVRYYGNAERLVLPSSFNGHHYFVDLQIFENRTEIKAVIAPALAEPSGETPEITSITYIEGNANLIATISSAGAPIEEIVITGGSTFSYFLENVDTLKKVTSYVDIGSYCLSYCENLQTVILGEGATGIGSYSFRGCTSLKEVYIGKDVTTLGAMAISDTTGFDVYVEDLAAWCEVTIDDVSWSSIEYPNPLANAANVYFDNALAVDLVIPEGVEFIGKNAFSGIKSIKSVSLPSTLTEIHAKAFRLCDNLETVTFSEGLLKIENEAFYGARALRAAILPETLTELGAYAFEYCKSLKEVYIPSLVLTIPTYAFNDCTSLSKVTFSDESVLTEIATYAFQNCKALLEIDIPDTVTSLGDYVFSSCKALKKIDLSALELTNIPTYAFEDCTALKKVTLPETLKIIDKCAFYETGVISITLPASLESIEKNAFYGCSKLLEVVNNSSITLAQLSSDNGCVAKQALVITSGESGLDYVGEFGFLTVDTYTYLVDYTGTERHVVFPDSYNGGNYTIPSRVFSYSDFVSIVLPSGVTRIESYAFSNSSDLVSVTIGSGITASSAIGSSAFSGCDKLVEVINKTSLQSFNSNTGLSYAKFIHNGETKIDYVDDFAFFTENDVHYLASYFGYAETIVLPESYKGESYSLYGSALYNVGNKEIILSENIDNIPTTALDKYSVKYNEYGNVKYLGTSTNPYYLAIGLVDGDYAELHDDTVKIFAKAFYGLYVESIVLNEGLKSIGQAAFSSTTFGCVSGTPEITIPSTVEVIEKNAFYMAHLNKLTLENGIKRIESGAFNSTNITDITIPESVEFIGYDAFANCGDGTANIYYNAINATTDGRVFSAYDYSGKFINLTIGMGVERIPDNLIRSTTTAHSFRIRTFTLNDPESLKYVGVCTFMDSEITEINLPSVVEIGSYAFSDATALSDITLGDSLTKIGYAAFKNCRLIEKITIPAGAELSSDILQGCDNLKEISLSLATKTFESLFGGAVNAPSTITKVTLTGDSICDSALSGFSSITDLEIASTVKTIGEDAFRAMWITSVKLPDGLERIGAQAFYSCTKLTSATIPAGVTFMGMNIFRGCTSLEYLEIPFMGKDETTEYTLADFFYSASGSVPKSLLTVKISAAKRIPENAFSEYNSTLYLTTIILPDNLESIGSSAFYGLKTLTSINVPDTVTEIGGSAFWNCNKLESLNIPSGITEIKYGTYAHCSSLTSIIVPDGVTRIEDMAFYNCTAATEISVPSTLVYLGSDVFPQGMNTDMLYTYDNAYYLGNESDNYVILYKTTAANISSVTINPATKIIAQRAFINCKSLTEISIPVGVISIGDYAFYGTSIERIDIPDTVKSIGEFAYSSIDNATVITLGDGLETVGAYAFSGNNSVTSVYLGSSLKKFENCAFQGTIIDHLFIDTLEGYLAIEFTNETANPFSAETALHYGTDAAEITSITIPAGITKIPDYAFTGFLKLKSITLGDDVTEIGTFALSGTGIDTVNFGTSLEIIGAYAFTNCNYLTYLELPASLTTIKTNAFASGALKAIFIPETVTSIGSYAFAYSGTVVCVEASEKPSGFDSNWDRETSRVIYGSNEIVIDENGVIYTLDSTTFIVAGKVGNSGEVVIKDKIDGYPVLQISATAFSGSSITSFKAGSSLRIIPEEAFANCKSLVSVDLSAATNLDYINNDTFSGCTSLSSVTLGANIASIGNYAFYNCSSLSTIELNPSLATIGNYAFSGTGLVEIVIPDSVRTVGTRAFYYATKLESVVIGSSVNVIGDYAFSNCTKLTSATFKNTDGWSANNSALTVSDSDLTANANLLRQTSAIIKRTAS